MTFISLFQRVSKLNKQNFDLKLEIFHRRQRTDTLEAQLEGKNAEMERLREQLEQMEVLESENAEAQKINEDLLKELEKRDQAIQEAVDMICRLEATVEKLEQRVRITSPSQLTTNSSEETAEQGGIQSSPTPVAPMRYETPFQDVPSREESNLATSPLRSPLRCPSFLREDNNTAPALRDLYQSDGENGSLAFGPLSRPASASSDEADGFAVDRQTLRSPALSMLSESSFMSVYGRSHELSPHRVTLPSPKQNNNIVWEDKLAQPSAHRSRKVQRGRSQQGNATPEYLKKLPATSAKNHIDSIGQVLESPKRPSYTSPQKAREHEVLRYLSQEREKESERRQPTFGGPMFDHHALPPTPDTLRTGTTATSSMNSIVGDRSFHDGSVGSNLMYSDVLPTADQRPKQSHVYRGSASEDDHAGNHQSEDETYSTFVHQGDEEEDDARAFLTSTTTAIKRMGLDRADTQGYGTNMMFNGTDYLPMDYSNAGFRNQQARSNTYSATSETSNSGSGRQINSSPPKSRVKAAKARDVTFREDQHLPGSQSSLNSQNQAEDQQHRLENSTVSHGSKSKYSSPEKPNTRSSMASPTQSKRSISSTQSQASARSTLASRLFRRTPTHASTRSSTTPTPEISATRNNISRSQIPHQITSSKHLHRGSIVSLSTPPQTSSEDMNHGTRPFQPAPTRVALRPGTAGSLDSVPRTRPRPLSTHFSGRRQALGVARNLSVGDPRASSVSLDLGEGDMVRQRGFSEEGEVSEASGEDGTRKAEGRRWGLGLGSMGGGRAASLRLRSGFGNGFGWRKERGN